MQSFGAKTLLQLDYYFYPCVSFQNCVLVIFDFCVCVPLLLVVQEKSAC